ncbi:MAG TPA: zeta toxin family protein, partial [Pseudomonadales bacterium]
EAVSWAKLNKQRIAGELTNKAIYPPDAKPVAFFMAGCPAAGKTEFAKAFAQAVGVAFNANGDPIMHIDADEIRELMPNYNGANSSLFQYPASIIVDRAFDLIMRNRQSFILDGTLSDERIAVRNVKRCLRKGYDVSVLYVYNNPVLAWEAARLREVRDGRAIDLDVFIDRYFKSKATIRRLKKEFGKDVHVDLLFKELDAKSVRPRFNVGDIDNYLPEKYTPVSLRAELTKSERK